MKANRADARIKILNAFMLAGAIIWSTAVLVRSTALMKSSALQAVVGVMPNFGVVWLGFGLLITFYPKLFKKEFNWRHSFAWVVAILCILIASEVVHYLFLGARFDIWDIGASVVAAVMILVVLGLTGR